MSACGHRRYRQTRRRRSQSPFHAGGAIALLRNAFTWSMAFLCRRSQMIANDAMRARNFRIGRLVEECSIEREAQQLRVGFSMTNWARMISAACTALLPDLFKDGKAVFAQRRLGLFGVFGTDQALAKHDQKRIAIETAEALKSSSPGLQQSTSTVSNKSTAGIVPARASGAKP